ncbi:MAG: UDP-N-acetylmuramoyl-tripeptide--D-alanyl-D-alanine ligase [Bacteroidales bacterium]|nr:UDP-N-acetylmuramoyl-tripeptide--D-alanyl-D-alanine ligase [Bacteroidales bacterium]
MKIQDIYQIYLNHPVVTTDSRNCPDGSIFIALKGDNFNGNKFAQQALVKGSAYAFVDEVEYANEDKIILVEDCLLMLQQLANWHRKQLTIPVIGITGTNGKTTTKELTASVLSKKFNVLFTKGNLNNHIGVPLTLLSINSTHDIAVIEMGANHQGEIKFLAEMAEPDFGLITNVGKAHLEGFGSFEGVIKTKGELYDFLRNRNRQIFIHQENLYLQKISDGMAKIAYGETPNLFVSGQITANNPYLSFEWSHSNQRSTVNTQLIGGYNLMNALAAAAIGLTFDIGMNEISTAIEEYLPQNNRSQLTKTDRNILVVDAYNANPSSMLAAVTNFGKMEVESKILILGDMFELGESSEMEHQKVVDLIEKFEFQKVLLCGEFFNETKSDFLTFRNTELLIEYLRANLISNSYVMIKGSRGMRLEKTIELL